MSEHDETRSIELTLPAAEYDRLQDLAGDDSPEAVLRDALDAELRSRAAVSAIEAREAAGELPGLPEIGPLDDSPVGALFGWEVTALGDGEAEMRMDATRRFANRGGPVQGGVITALADTATAFAFMTTLDEGESTTNMELKINFLRPVFDDELEATARVVNRGSTTGLIECDVHNSEEKLVARLSTTYMVI